MDVDERGFAGALKRTEIDPDEFPVGRTSRVMVEMVHDALGRAVRVPVLVKRGARPGPVFGLTAALHGDELNGIPVLHRLFERVDANALRGTLVGVVVVNVMGYFRHQRYFSDSRDLNHLMPGVRDGNDSEVFAYRLLDRIVKRFDYLLDLHTASFGRINSLYVRADMKDPLTARMAYLQRPQIVLHNPASDRTLRGAAGELGIPGITVEIGDPQRFQPELIKRTLVGVRAVLAEVKMMARRKVALGPPPVICSSSRWLYAEHGGLLRVLPRVTEHVEEGEVVATLANVFGDVIRQYRAPHAGIVIGRSVNPVAQTGARILHLGRIAGPDLEGFVPRE